MTHSEEQSGLASSLFSYKQSKWNTASKGIMTLVIIFIAAITFYRCPLRLLFGIPCPCCGYTSALVACLSLDIPKAFNNHPLFPLITLDLMYLVFRENVKLPTWVEQSFLMGSLLIVLGMWLFRFIISGYFAG